MQLHRAWEPAEIRTHCPSRAVASDRARDRSHAPRHGDFRCLAVGSGLRVRIMFAVVVELQV